MSKKKKLQTVSKQEMQKLHGCLNLQIKVLGRFQIISSLATSLFYAFNRSFDRTIWKKNTCMPDAREADANKGRLSKLHNYQFSSLGKVCYRFENIFDYKQLPPVPVLKNILVN